MPNPLVSLGKAKNQWTNIPLPSPVTWKEACKVFQDTSILGKLEMVDEQFKCYQFIVKGYYDVSALGLIVD